MDQTPGYEFAASLFTGYKTAEKKDRKPKAKPKKPVSIFKTPQSKSSIAEEEEEQIASQPPE